jgi:hypothetical protein
MSVNNRRETEHTETTVRLRRILLEPARREDDLASSEAAASPYWAPHPSSVIGHRVAAHADGQVGYVRLDLGPQCSGPSSAYWDGWFNVTATRSENPLRGKAMRGDLVQLLSGARS